MHVFNVPLRLVVLVPVAALATAVAAEPAPSLKQLLELDTRQAARKPAAAPSRSVRTVVRPRLLAIYGPVGGRTVLVRQGTQRLLFTENERESLPRSAYQMVDIRRHCVVFRRAGQKTVHESCLSPSALVEGQDVVPSTPPPAVLPWPVGGPR